MLRCLGPMTRGRLCAATGAVLLATAPACRPSTTRMIDVGGHRLEVAIEGQGAPAVVFDAGFIGGMSAWRVIQDSVARLTRTLAYERAGLGGSEVGPEPRTAERIAEELHTLLDNANIGRPVVLVGHSAGGMFIRVFAAMYPDEVAGLILVDPATVAVYEYMQTESPERWVQFEQEVERAIEPPPGWYGQWRALPQSMEQARRAVMPTIPVVVLTALVPIPGEWPFENAAQMQVWQDAHRDLAERIPGVRHIVLPDANHMSVLGEPALVHEILALVEDVRSGR